jgi:hemoglobin/transferrin/lactoferrin receptor protein
MQVNGAAVAITCDRSTHWLARCLQLATNNQQLENRMTRNISRLYLGVSALLLPGTVCAANATGVLEEVVVTASRYEQRVFDSPATLSVIDELAIERSTAFALADLLRDVPGVQVTDSGQAGLERIRIRGEESRRSAILINSMELTDHHEVGTPLTLDPSMIERVELIRGSGSVLYGSRALSGVVNFLTRKGGTKPLQGTVSASWDGASEGYGGFASVYGNIDGFEYRVAYSERDHDERQSPQGEIENTSFDNSNAYLYAGKSFADQRIEYSYENYQSSSDIFVEEEVRTSFPLTDFALSTPRRDRERHALVYNLDLDGGWLDSFEFRGFYQESDRLFVTRTETVWYERDIDSDSTLTSTGALLQLDSTPGADHRLIAGLQYLGDEVDQTRHVETFSWTPTIPGGIEDIRDKASIDTWALFVQDEWSASERLTVTAGLREYYVESKLQDTNRDSLTPGKLDDDSELIGALGLVYDYSDVSRLRANVSQGYVYPSLMQLATGAYAGSSFVHPAADLQPETSVNYEMGLRLQDGGLVLDAAAFYTTSDDYIHHLPCRPEDMCPGRRDRLYQNIGKSRAHGAELLVEYTIDRLALTPYLNLTWMKRRNEYADFSTWDSGVPEASGSAGVRWSGALPRLPALWADVYLRGETASELKEPGSSRTVVENKSSWATLNIAGGASFGDQQQYQVVVELHNLLDETYITSAENLYGAERSVGLKLSVDL